MVGSYLASAAVLALLTVAPGPDVAVVSRIALTSGRQSAILAAFGVVSGLVIWGLASVVGLAAVLTASTRAYAIVRLAGGGYLVLMGARAIWRSCGGGRSEPDAKTVSAAAGSAWRRGLLANLLNPKIAVFYTSLLPSLVPHGSSPRIWLPVLVATHLLLSILWLVCCAFTLSRSRSLLGRPQARRWLDRLSGLVLVGFGLRVAVEAR